VNRDLFTTCSFLHFADHAGNSASGQFAFQGWDQMSPQAFTLAGFERISGVDYAQSWLVSDL